MRELGAKVLVLVVVLAVFVGVPLKFPLTRGSVRKRGVAVPTEVVLSESWEVVR